MNNKLIGLVLVVLGALACAEMSSNANPWYRVSGGDWHPSVAQVQEIKDRIAPFVIGEATSQNRHMLPWQQYVFQYHPVVEKSKRVIFVNALCKSFLDSRSTSTDLQARIITVLDGGECFFQVKYDPSVAEFYDLFINGQA